MLATLPPTAPAASHVAGHGGVVKVGDMGMSRYAAQWRSQGDGGGLERTLTPGEQLRGFVLLLVVPSCSAMLLCSGLGQ